jgi:DNA-directed RNA polymerase subunit M/transcription elongation factor TFIIS
MGLLDGEVMPSNLVNMTNEDLATQEQKYEREQALKADMMSRDLDWVKNNRDEILRANGYDPNMGGEFKCKGCKSTKTSHYAMQTRSSDEPMTIFVTCLGCGNRWRS